MKVAKSGITNWVCNLRVTEGIITNRVCNMKVTVGNNTHWVCNLKITKSGWQCGWDRLIPCNIPMLLVLRC